jgi:O-antigen/teichoic acid export membrane protein
MIIPFIVTLVILLGLGIAVAVEQADARRNSECDSRKEIFFRYGTLRALPY